MTTISELYNLEDSDCEILYRIDTDELSVEVRQFHELRWLHINGVSIQSVYNLESPAFVFNPVTAIMLCATTITNEPQAILNIGLGGASIERYLSERKLNATMHSVESSELIIHIAREFFQLPYDFPVFNQAAEHFIEDIDQQYDLIFCDIFDNEAHPACLYDADFYQHLSRLMPENGTFAVNLLSQDEADLINILQAMRRHFSHTFLVKIESHNNVVVFARTKPLELEIAELTSQFKDFLHTPLIHTFPFHWQLHPLPDISYD